MIKRLYSLLFLLSMISFSKAQESINLYPNGLLNSIDGVSSEGNTPEFYFYKPTAENVKKFVFLIIPGGGYSRVAMGHEGHDVAQRLRDLGYASFVLRYRLPVDSQMLDKRIAPIQDAQTALLYIKTHADRLGYDSNNVVVIGFSAGGHLASTLSTHFETSYIGDVKNKSFLRPDYSVLVYPVITMAPGRTHSGSKNNLIGSSAKEEDMFRFSNENNVTSDTPPTYLMHAEDDKVVPFQNVVMYKEKLDKFQIDNRLYVYNKGGHGFGMVNKLEAGDWFLDMLNWLNNK